MTQLAQGSGQKPGPSSGGSSGGGQPQTSEAAGQTLPKGGNDAGNTMTDNIGLVALVLVAAALVVFLSKRMRGK